MSFLRQPSTAAPRSYRTALDNPSALPVLSNRKIVFHAINKSGSSALTRVLAASYADAGRGAELHTHYQSGTAKTAAEVRHLIESSPSPGFFAGHYLYGAFDLPPEEYGLVTLFRHPLPRTISIYQWLKGISEKKGELAAPFPSLEEWVRASRGKRSSQLIHFAAPFVADRRDIVSRYSAAEMLPLAMQNIERDVAALGIAEYFEESIFLFAQLCGLEYVLPWKRDNRNKGRPMAWDIPESTQDLIRDVYRADFQLYEWVRQRFLRTVAEAGISGEISEYKTACLAQYKDRLLDGAAPSAT